MISLFETITIEFEKLQSFVQKNLFDPGPKLSFWYVLQQNLKNMFEISTVEYAKCKVSREAKVL